jgi:hypothetical protein
VRDPDHESVTSVFAIFKSWAFQNVKKPQTQKSSRHPTSDLDNKKQNPNKMSNEKFIMPTTTYTAVATVVDEPSSDKPLRTAKSQFATLPEVQNLTWSDSFFDNEDDDVVAVFDFDYEGMEDFYTSVGWSTLACTVLYTPVMVLALVGLAPCYLRRNVQWNTRSQHVAITRDGIRFVRDKRSSCWGMPCSEKGKSSKTVPFDKITDCDIEEPAGNSCICITNILTTVNVDTASSGNEGRKELKIAGLKDPHSFKKLVWAMKRNQGMGLPLPNRAPASLAMADRHLQQGGSDEDVACILKDIRDELRQHNDLLHKMRPVLSDSTAKPSAPMAPSETEFV